MDIGTAVTVSTIVGLLAAVSGAVVSVAARRLSEFSRILFGSTDTDKIQKISARGETEVLASTGWRTTDAGSPTLVARSRVVLRIKEAATFRKEQLGIRKWSKIAANLLTIAQYIIGGVLASSFVQESLTPKWVGGLGVLVLIASLFKQQFHPEINAEDARKKAYELQALVRSSEDQLAIIDAKIPSGQDHSDAMIALLKEITQTLNKIELNEPTQATVRRSK